jgi:hypothetical protein
MRSLEQLVELLEAGDHFMLPEFVLRFMLRNKTSSVDEVEQIARCVPDRDAIYAPSGEGTVDEP